MSRDELALYIKGKDAYQRGHFHEAERCLVKILKFHRNYADIYCMLGTIFAERGRFGDAIRLYAKALEINSSYTEAKVNLMVLFQDLGRYDRSRQILEEIQRGVDSFPQTPDPLSKNRLANLHATTGDMYAMLELYDAAIREYEEALKMRPSYADIRIKLARAYKETGQLDMAESNCRAALRANPKFTHARLLLGSILLAQEKRDDAIDTWREILLTEPKNEDVIRLLRAAGEDEGLPPALGEKADAALSDAAELAAESAAELLDS
ncbi:MAG: tetratricopeptide repeat protein [Deltaproteobacteria bacterium]|nr:tetratricopeptide repeat protein [bacterium]MCB9475711.1 tetratricopeptide repeat protein [Deltaproteobacteria bacterium]MCB9479233.1 tetratricopeptide repeat protein [Deltaproteobacteria bacterium]MCB9490029.1 tetratricopeptide repeat protein [Deltaproteobacteria bacterium]